jgi:large subunit ribosomal protein L5
MSNEETKKVEPRMKEMYRTAVVPEMMKRHNWTNALQVPRLKKVVVNMGLSEARENAKVVDLAADELAVLTGQKPQVRRAKKAISNFKLRAGMPIGVRVTLRASRMWDFMDRLVNIAIPRIRDFAGWTRTGGSTGKATTIWV